MQGKRIVHKGILIKELILNHIREAVSVDSVIFSMTGTIGVVNPLPSPPQSHGMAELERLNETSFRIHPPIDCRKWLWAESVYGKTLRFRDRLYLILLMPWWNAMAKELEQYRQWLTSTHTNAQEKKPRVDRCQWRTDA